MKGGKKSSRICSCRKNPLSVELVVTEWTASLVIVGSTRFGHADSNGSKKGCHLNHGVLNAE